MRWLNWLRHLFGPPTPPLTQLSVRALLADPATVWLSCDEVFQLLDDYADRAARGEDVAHLLPTMHAHLEQCPGCRAQYEALARLLAEQARQAGHTSQ